MGDHGKYYSKVEYKDYRNPNSHTYNFSNLFNFIDWAAFDLNFYRREYEKLNIPESTGMNQDDLLKVTQELLDYIRGKREDLMVVAPVHGQERQVFNQGKLITWWM